MDLIDREQAIEEIYRKVSEQESNAIQGEDLDVGVIVGLKMAVRIIKDQPSAEKTGKWFSVSERLPEHGQEVLCACRAGIYEVLKYVDGISGPWYKDSRHVYMKGFVTHWMPLPEPPAGAALPAVFRREVE